MFQLLNRFAWILSFSLSFVIIVGFFLIIGEIDDNDVGGISLFLVPIGGLIIKKILLSDAYIRERVSFFADKLSTRSHKGTVQKTSPIQDQVEIKEDIEIEVVEEGQSYMASQDAVPIISKPREANAIEKFFSENILAKLGGILVFLGVLFLLSLVYSIVGPVTKMCIGFGIGFSLYGAGVWLDKKGFIGESRIVMGVAILVNYLVILSGRHLLGDYAQNPVGIVTSVKTGEMLSHETYTSILTVGMTFFFLILNTIFAVVTALLYKSRPLLIFAFGFAYLNPLLLGESSTEPYTLLGYTMIVTLGALYMSYTRKDQILFPLTFVLASIMFLIAPWSDASGWVTKLLCINTLGALSLYCSSVFKKSFQNISEILIAGTFFLIGIMGLLGIENLSNLQMIIMGASSLALMAFCYMSMNKGAYLYSIGTLGTILTLSPAIYTNGLDEATIGTTVLIIATFAIMNIGIVATKGEQLIAGNLGSIISGLLSGAIFLTYMIYFYGNVFFPGMLQGFAFFGLAIIYCLLAFHIVSKIGIETMKSDLKYENTFYTISAIGVSLFSLAVAFVFSESKEIVSIIWLLEANVLFFLSRKTSSLKIAVAGLVLFAIGIVKFVDFIDFGLFWGTSFSGDYGMLVALVIVLVSLICNLVLLFNEKMTFLKTEFYGLHNLFHLTGIGLIVLTGHEILDISMQWYSLLYFSVAIAALGALYDRISSPGLKVIHLIAYLGLMAIHIMLFADDMGRESLDLTISTVIAGIYALPFIYDIMTKGNIKNRTLLTVFLLYLFILSTLYVYHIFAGTFAVTLYWGILSFVLLGHGISKDILYLRTVGLYLISLTAGKVFLYDIWMSVDDTVSRVVALIVVGILMIVLSTMYTRKYGNNLNSEFNPSNLFPDTEENTNKVESAKGASSVKIEKKSQIQNDIESIDITGINSVKLHFKGEEKPTTIRTQNLIKISKLIANTYKKTNFAPGELKAAFTTIEKDYKSSLSPAQYKKLKDLVAEFVTKGGSIEFIK